MIRNIILIFVIFATTGGGIEQCGKSSTGSHASNTWDELPGGPTSSSWLCTVWRPKLGEDPCEMVGGETGTEYVQNAIDSTQAAIQAASQKSKKNPGAIPPWGCFPANCSRTPINGIGSPPPGGCSCEPGQIVNGGGCSDNSNCQSCNCDILNFVCIS